jgi:hypothetical protein
MTVVAETTKEIPIFEIPDCNMPMVETKIAKLNKRAAKIGADPIQIVVVKKWEKQLKDNNSYDDTFTVIPMTTIQVMGSAPKLNGWTLVSVVEPVENGILLRKFPGVEYEIPIEFRDVTPDRCDHCHTKRQRNETFIVCHVANNEWKVVGRTCLADFTGCNNPEQIANYASSLYDLTISIKDEESLGGFGGNSGYYCAPIRSFLKLVAIWSARHGFVTATEAYKRNQEDDSYIVPTGKLVFGKFFNPSSELSSKERQQFIDTITDSEDEAAEDLVDDAMQWGKTQFVDANESNLSDYGHNMKLLLAADRVRVIDVGYVASVIKGYKRAIESRVEITYKGYVGEIGKQITTNVTIKKIHEWAGQYGLTNITTMQDDDGNVLTWFAPADKKMVVGMYKTMIAKVKRHDERNGQKSTVVTYPKFI